MVIGARGVVVKDQREWRRVLAAVALALPLIPALYAYSLRGSFQFDGRHPLVEKPVVQTSGVVRSWWGSRAGMIGAATIARWWSYTANETDGW